MAVPFSPVLESACERRRALIVQAGVKNYKGSAAGAKANYGAICLLSHFTKKRKNTIIFIIIYGFSVAKWKIESR